MVKSYPSRCFTYALQKSINSGLNWAGTIGVAGVLTVKHYGGIEFSFPNNEFGIIVSSLIYTFLASLIFFIPRFLHALIISKHPQEFLFGTGNGFYNLEDHPKIKWHKINVAVLNKDIQPLLDCRVLVENTDLEGKLHRRCPLSSFEVLPTVKKYIQIADYKERIDVVEVGEFTITLNSSGKAGFASYQDSLSENCINKIIIKLESQGQMILEQQCHIWVKNKRLYLEPI